MPDLVVVATDANCSEIGERRKRLAESAKPIADHVIYAVPNPHVERWLLLDPAAFKTVLGSSCAAPDEECNRNRYKRILAKAVQDAGQVPLLGGMEHAEDIVSVMNLPNRKPQSELDEFVAELRARFRSWI